MLNSPKYVKLVTTRQISNLSIMRDRLKNKSCLAMKCKEHKVEVSTAEPAITLVIGGISPSSSFIRNMEYTYPNIAETLEINNCNHRSTIY